MERLSHYGSIAGSVAAILGLLWLLGEPHLRTYIDAEIELYDSKKKEENSKKVPFRELLGDKMGLDADEVHIEIGHQYRKEKILYKTVDSLKNIIGKMKTEDKDLLNDINANYRDILDLQEKLRQANERHGLFN